MSWQELQITVDADEVPRTEALLRLAGALAISLTAEEERDELLEPPPGETPLWSSVVLRALFPPTVSLDSVVVGLNAALDPPGEIAVRDVSDADWKDAWERQPTQRRVGSRLLLAAADADVAADGRHVVRLNLGLAFGTGEHATTALCLGWLDGRLREGATVLDYGCGSGILAMAALRLGAASAWAVDVDPQALSATRANANLNGVEGELWIGTPEELPAIQVDVIIANILAGALMELEEVFHRSIKPGGRIVLSGILESQSEAVRRHFAERFGAFEENRENGWILLCARSRKTSP